MAGSKNSISTGQKTTYIDSSGNKQAGYTAPASTTSNTAYTDALVASRAAAASAPRTAVSQPAATTTQTSANFEAKLNKALNTQASAAQQAASTPAAQQATSTPASTASSTVYKDYVKNHKTEKATTQQPSTQAGTAQITKLPRYTETTPQATALPRNTNETPQYTTMPRTISTDNYSKKLDEKLQAQSARKAASQATGAKDVFVNPTTQAASAAPAATAPYKTTYRDGYGNVYTGWIINGKTYQDEAGTKEVPVGSYVTDANGNVWRKGYGNDSQLVSSTNPDYHYDYMEGVQSTTSQPFTDPATGYSGYIVSNPLKGVYYIEDSQHHQIGYITTDGVYHSAYYDSDYDKSMSSAAKDVLTGQGVQFNGDGIVKIANGQDQNMERTYLLNQFSAALENGEDATEILAQLGVTRENAQPGTPIAEYFEELDAAKGGAGASGNQRATGATGAGSGTSSALYKEQQDRAIRQIEREQSIQSIQENLAQAGTASGQSFQLSPTQTGTASGQNYSTVLQDLENQLKDVDDLLEQAKADNDALHTQQLEQIRARIEEQIATLNEQYQALNRQLYVDYMKSRRDLPQLLAAQGYTGGLRESSMLGLETAYSENLAQNERERMSGIRDIEAGGLDNEMTLAIENAKAQQEAEERAYDRAAKIRAAIIEQKNYEDKQERESQEKNQQLAQQQINAYLSAGGSPAGIPAELLAVSGLSPSYVNTIAANVARQRELEEQQRERQWTLEDQQRERQWALEDQQRELEAQTRAQNQVNSYLSAGIGSESIPADLLAASGYDTAYLDALIGKQAAATAEPKLTAAQVNAAIKEGNLSPQVLADYEYYYGAPYQTAAPAATAAAASGGGGYDNAGLSMEQVKQIQRQAGLTGSAVDGKWGSQTTAAVGMTAAQYTGNGGATPASIAAGVKNIINNGGAYAYEDAANYAYAYVANGLIDENTAAAIVADAMKK
jgi:hypothetical protein